MRNLLPGFLLLNVLTACSPKTEKVDTVTEKMNIDDKNEITAGVKERSIMGVWTDGSGPNASVRFEKDSIYDVEHFDRTKYELIGDSLIIYYEGEPFKSKIKKADADSLIYISEYGEVRMWRFKN